MNSVLQCLFHVPLLLHFLESGEWANYPNRGPLLGEFVSLLKESWSGTLNVFNPHTLKNTIDTLIPQFRNRDPHDAHEFLGCLLKQLHDEMNVATGKPQSIKTTLDPQKAWNAMRQTDNSPIIDLFFGLTRHTLTCPQCDHRQSTYEPFMTLPLPLPQRKIVLFPFVFVPANPVEPMKSMKLKLFSVATLEEFDEGLSLELKKKVSVAFAEIQNGSHRANWLPNYQKPRPGHEIYAFEVVDHWKLHAVVWLCIKVRKPLSKNMIETGTPYVLNIPSSTVSQCELLELCEDFFSYLWDSATAQGQKRSTVPSDLADLREKLMTFKKPWTRRFNIKLEMSMFSKTMKFKPIQGKLNVYAVLNTNYIVDDTF